jgi:hypothetical protein
VRLRGCSAGLKAAAKVRFLGMENALEKKNGKIFPKMFGVLKNVVFLHPQTKGH